MSVGGIAKSQGVCARTHALRSVFLETESGLSQCCGSSCSCLMPGAPGLHLLEKGFRDSLMHLHSSVSVMFIHRLGLVVSVSVLVSLSFSYYSEASSVSAMFIHRLGLVVSLFFLLLRGR